MATSRRGFLSATAAGVLGASGPQLLALCNRRRRRGGGINHFVHPKTRCRAGEPYRHCAVMPLAANADEALALLTDGNQRFVVRSSRNMPTTMSAAESPSAALSDRSQQFLSCIDSRVPVELIFDRGFGDLVVVSQRG